jgi:hypothetical protein
MNRALPSPCEPTWGACRKAAGGGTPETYQHRTGPGCGAFPETMAKQQCLGRRVRLVEPQVKARACDGLPSHCKDRRRWPISRIGWLGALLRSLMA